MIFSTYLYSKQPSFDCNKVEKQSCEAIICSSDTLIDLDYELSGVYKQALSKAPKEDMLKAYQRGWIKGRNECWKVKDAQAFMADLYRQRINELKEKYQLNDEIKKFMEIQVSLIKHFHFMGSLFMSLPPMKVPSIS